MHTSTQIHLWLIRIYAFVILFVSLTGMLEGAAYKLLISLACIATIVQTFLLISKNDSVKTQTPPMNNQENYETPIKPAPPTDNSKPPL